MEFPSLKKLLFGPKWEAESFLFKNKTQKPQDLHYKPIFFLDQAKIMLRVEFIKLNEHL